MSRRLLGAFAFILLFAIAAPLSAGDPARSLPMQFAVRQEGPAVVCRDKCRTWVSAVGTVRPNTVQEFERFAEKNNVRGMMIAFDSEGGSVLGAIALGRSIRKLDMTTTVGRTIEIASAAAKERRAKLSPRADCESMCAFLMLAGAKRIVPPEARVRVHQIWLGDRREDAAAATYSAEDLVLVQRDIGRLAQYTFEMGGTAELLEISLRIPPWEPMRSLTRDELRRMRLDMVESAADVQPSAAVSDPQLVPEKRSSLAPAAPAAVAPASDSVTSTTVATPISATPAAIKRLPITSAQRGALTERSWILLNQDTPILARRHPLTREGESIGSFDVMFGCTDTPNEYAVFYVEMRRSRQPNGPEPLREVSLVSGGKIVPLTVATSELHAKGSERETSASGTVPATMLKTFGEGGPQSLSIITAMPSGRGTSVRVGNTGVMQVLPKLTAACAQTVRTEHVGLVPGAR
jgi:hypothetical protein